MVRFAAVQLISQLSDKKAAEPVKRSIGELRVAVSSRLADASPMVRFAAFRSACGQLSLERPNGAREAADLLVRAKLEGENIQNYVFKTLETCFFTSSSSAANLDRLVDLTANQDVGCENISELLRTHRAARGDQIFASSMKDITSHAVQRLQGQTDDDPRAFALLLEAISFESPEAFLYHIPALQTWISVGSEVAQNKQLLARHGCRILTNALPHWAKTQRASTIHQAGRQIQDCLESLLEAPDFELVREAASCFCKLSQDRILKIPDVLAHFNEAFSYARQAVERRLALDANGQRRICRVAWILGSMLEFMDVEKFLRETTIGNDLQRKGIAQATARLLCAMFVNGPQTLAMKSNLVQCIGFIARRQPNLLHFREVGSVYEVFKIGLAAKDETCTLTSSTLRSLHELMEIYQEQAEKACGQTKISSSVTEATNSLASLQPEILCLLSRVQMPAVVNTALGVFKVMQRSGVLHAASVMPGLLSMTLCGHQTNVVQCRALLLDMIEGNPQSLANRISAGIRTAASQISSRSNFNPGETARERWRFTAITEVYSEYLEARAAKEKFLDTLVGEFRHLCTDEGVVANPREVLLRAEITLGILSRIPFRTEADVAYVLRCASEFLILRAMPMLSGDTVVQQGTECGEKNALFAVVALSVLLYLMCEQWAHFVDGPRLLKAAESSAETSGADQPLPAAFSRRPPLELSGALRELTRKATEDDSALVGYLVKTVQSNSWLLRGQGGAQSRKRRSSVRGGAGNSVGGKPCASGAKKNRRQRAPTS